MDTETRARFEPTLRTARILTGAMVASLAVYAVLVKFLDANGGGPTPGEGAQMFRYMIYGLAVMTLVGVRFVRQFLLARGAQGAAALQQLLTAQVITGALVEAAGLYGLVLYFIHGLTYDAFVLIGLSAVMMVLYFPRAAAWEAYLEERQRESGRAV